MKIKILLYNLLGLIFIFSSSQSYSVDQEKLEAKQILQSSELSLKKLIANNINLRQIPKLQFRIDETFEYARNIENILQKIKK